MKIFLRLSILIIVLLSYQAINAQSIKEKLLSISDSICSQYGETIYPGTAVLIVKDGETVLNKGYGLANIEHNIPNSPTTVFDIGSVSKLFTGYAISLLIEQGELSPSDDIRKYLPELPDYGHVITIDHLLHHNSGIPNYIRLIFEAGWSFNDRITSQHLLRLAYKQKQLDFVPGEKYQYSNTGYLFLAAIVEKVSGVSFRKWTQQNIFEPLEMTQSVFVDDQSIIIPEKANSYFFNGEGAMAVAPNNSQTPGPASLNTSTSDLAKWIKFMNNPPENKKAVFERMFTPGELNDGTKMDFGYSVRIRKANEVTRIIHQGFWPEYLSLFVYIPELKLGVVSLSNHKWNSFGFLTEAESIYNDKKVLSKKEKTEAPEIKVSSKRLQSYVGTYKLSPGFIMKVTKENDQLFSNISFDGEDVFPMKALSDSTFFIEDYRWEEIAFIKNNKGEVTYAIYQGEKCAKISDIPAFEPEMREFVGRYIGDEVETLYTVSYQDDQLALNHLRIGGQKLKHVREEDFLVDRWESRFPKGIQFTRDKKGAVNGFQMEKHLFTKIIDRKD